MRFRFGEFEADTTRFLLYREGQAIPVDRKVFDLLAYFLERPGTLISRDDLLADVWDGIAVAPKAVNTALYELRRVLIDNPKRPRFVETVRGRGFRFVGEVQRVVLGTRGEVFVGRQRELEALASCLESTRSEGGQAVVVSGPAGIGKSRLVEQFVAERVEPEAVVVGRCSESELAPPYLPWLQILKRLVSRDEHTGSKASVLSAISGGRRNGPQISPFEVASEVVERIGSARHRVQVIVLEDVHCADPASIEVLKSLCFEIHETGVLLVCTSRPDSGFTKGVLAASLTSARELSLGGLGLADLEALASELGRDVGSARDLLVQTGGNPLYAGLVLARNASAGASLSVLVRRELEPATRECRSVLEAIAVFGREVGLDVLSAVAGVGISEWVHEAEALSLLEVAEGRVRFSHILLRDAVYLALDPRERERLHREAARCSESAGDRAHHLARATSLVHWSELVEAHLAASREAAVSGAVEDALRHLDSAGLAVDSSTPEASGLSTRIQIRIGEVLVRAGRKLEGRRKLLRAHESALEGGHSDLAVDAAVGALPGLLAIEAGSHDPLVASALEACLTFSLDSKMESRVCSLLAIANTWAPRARERNAQLIERARLVAGNSDAAVECAAYVVSHSPDNLGERVHLSARCRELSWGSGNRDEMVLACVISVALSLETGDRGSFERHCRELERVTDEADSLEASWYPDLYRATRLMMEGEFRAVEDVVSGLSVRLAGREDANIRQSLGALVAVVRYHQGRAEEVLPALEAIGREVPAAWIWRSSEALVRAIAGDREGASQLLDALLPWVGQERDLLWLFSSVLLAETSIELRRLDIAAALLPALERYSDRNAIAGFGILSWGSTSRVVGRLRLLLNDVNGAVEDLRRAVAAEKRMQDVPWTARSLVELGAALAAAGDSSAAEISREGESLLRSLGGRKHAMQSIKGLAS